MYFKILDSLSVECNRCETVNIIEEDQCSDGWECVSSSNRQMGMEKEYENVIYIYCKCGNNIEVKLNMWEYPSEIVNHIQNICFGGKLIGKFIVNSDVFAEKDIEEENEVSKNTKEERMSAIKEGILDYIKGQKQPCTFKYGSTTSKEKEAIYEHLSKFWKKVNPEYVCEALKELLAEKKITREKSKSGSYVYQVNSIEGMLEEAHNWKKYASILHFMSPIALRVGKEKSSLSHLDREKCPCCGKIGKFESVCDVTLRANLVFYELIRLKCCGAIGIVAFESSDISKNKKSIIKWYSSEEFQKEILDPFNKNQNSIEAEKQTLEEDEIKQVVDNCVAKFNAVREQERKREASENATKLKELEDKCNSLSVDMFNRLHQRVADLELEKEDFGNTVKTIKDKYEVIIRAHKVEVAELKSELEIKSKALESANNEIIRLNKLNNRLVPYKKEVISAVGNKFIDSALGNIFKREDIQATLKVDGSGKALQIK